MHHIVLCFENAGRDIILAAVVCRLSSRRAGAFSAPNPCCFTARDCQGILGRSSSLGRLRCGLKREQRGEYPITIVALFTFEAFLLLQDILCKPALTPNKLRPKIGHMTAWRLI